MRSIRFILLASLVVCVLGAGLNALAVHVSPLAAVGGVLTLFTLPTTLGCYTNFGPSLNLLDVVKIKGSDAVVGLVEENLSYAPEVILFPVRQLDGTDYKTLVRTGLPAVDFIAASAGIAAGKSTFDNKHFECGILGGRVEVWKTVLDSKANGTPAEIKATESSGVMEAAIRKVGRQIIYGKTALGSALGFAGLVSFVDSAMIADATGSTADTGSSVYFIKFGPKDVQLVMGNNGTMDLGEFRVESLTDSAGNKGPGEVADLASWIGLQCASKNSIVRIKNLTAQTGKGVTDDLLATALDLFPAGIVPDVILMSRRSRTQLRKSRSALVALQSDGKTGTLGGGAAYVPTPTDFEGIKIVATDSILNTEPIA